MLAYPLLVMDTPALKKADLSVNVAYAYFGIPYLDPNISGLWRNYSNPLEIINVGGTSYELDVNVISYFIVLNITNNANQATYITNFDTIVAPSISVESNGVLRADNSLLRDSRDVSYYPGWNNIWSANTSRLVYLSGIIGVHDLVYESLNSGSIWIHEQVEGQSYGNSNVLPFGIDYKQLSFQSFGEGYLYNNLIGENQTLIFYNGLDVSIGTRIPH